MAIFVSFENATPTLIRGKITSLHQIQLSSGCLNRLVSSRWLGLIDARVDTWCEGEGVRERERERERGERERERKKSRAIFCKIAKRERKFCENSASQKKYIFKLVYFCHQVFKIGLIIFTLVRHRYHDHAAGETFEKYVQSYVQL